MQRFLICVLTLSLVPQSVWGAEPIPGQSPFEVGEWRDLPPLPVGVAGHSCWWQEETLVVAGGSYWEGGKKRFVSSVWSYTLGAELWREGGVLPLALSYMLGATQGAFRYFIGGATATATSAGVYRLGGTFPDAPEWTSVEPLPQAVALGGGAVIGSRYYLVGGSSDVDDLTKCSNALYIYDFNDSGGRWSRGPSLPGVGRCLAAVAAVQGSLYVSGGFRIVDSDTYENLSDAFIYRPQKLSWEPVRELPFPLRSAGSSSYLDRYIFIVGGSGVSPSPVRFDTVLLFDAVSNTYTQMRSLPYGVAIPQVLIRDSRLYVIGGEPPGFNRISRVIWAPLDPRPE